MAWGETEWIDRAIIEAQAGLPDGAFPFADADSLARELIDAVLRDFSCEIANSPQERGHAQETFTLTIQEDGKITIPDGLLVEALNNARWKIEGIDFTTEPVCRLDHYSDFYGYLLPNFYYYCVANGFLYFRHWNAFVAIGSELQLTASRHLLRADIAAFPEQWQDHLVTKLARAILAKK